jgi:general secretion pathway protein G
MTMQTSEARQKGFTILEILIVFVLLAAIMGVVAQQIFSGKDKAETNLAKTQLIHVAGQIGLYQTETKRYPQSLQDLVKQPAGVENWRTLHLKASELRRLGQNDYVYKVPGTEGRRFDLISYGADGRPGGEGADRDISN